MSSAPSRAIAKPSVGEYPAYAAMYIDLLPDDGRLLAHLRGGAGRARDLVAPLPEERLLSRYAEGKWTALAYHIAGHELHHLNVLRQRYLPQEPPAVRAR